MISSQSFTTLYHASRVALRYYIYERSTCFKDDLEDAPLFHSYQEFRLCMMAYLLYGLFFIAVPWARRTFIHHWNDHMHDFELEWLPHFKPPLYPLEEEVASRWKAHAPSLDPCSICIEDTAQEPWVELSCQHLFHKSCLTKWFSRSLTCPLCRKVV